MANNKANEAANEHLEKLKQVGMRGAYGAGNAIPALASMSIAGLIPTLLGPIRRDMWKNTSTSFKPNTEDRIFNLAVKMLRAGKYPEKERDIAIVTKPTPAAMFGRAPKRKGSKKIIDHLLLGKGIKPEIMAHEVGHALAPNRATELFRELSTKVRQRPYTFLPSALALTGALSTPDDPKKAPLSSTVAPYLGAAQLATILGEEARANVNALKILKNMGQEIPLKQKLKMFAPMTTYLSHAGLLVAAPLAIKKGITYYNQIKAKERDAGFKTLAFKNLKTMAEAPDLKDVKEKWSQK